MQYFANYFGTRFFSTLRGFCPLRIKITQFSGGFRLKTYSWDKE